MSKLDEIVAEEFGRKLRAARQKAGLSQEELSHRSAIHRTQVGQLERGLRVPRLSTLLKLAGALGVEPCELLGELRWNPPPSIPAQGEFRRKAS